MYMYVYMNAQVCERLGGVTIQKAWVPSHSLSKHFYSALHQGQISCRLQVASSDCFDSEAVKAPWIC